MMTPREETGNSEEKSMSNKVKAFVARRLGIGKTTVCLTLFAVCALLPLTLLQAGDRRIGFLPIDPGPRPGAAGAGGFVAGLTTDQLNVADATIPFYKQINNVTGTAPIGLGPRFSSNQCSSCHAQPAPGGSSPSSNPLFAIYQLKGATNTMPSFITPTGPVLDARFPYQIADTSQTDGTVHPLFTITGRSDAVGCSIAQPDFVTAQNENDLVLRQPLPTYGDGLLEIILNSDILANWNSNLTLKESLGISGHPNYIGNDGSINRFGWKAQQRSVTLISGQAYNVDMGVTNDMFPGETDETTGCLFNPIPESSINFLAKLPVDYPGDPDRFAIFTRFLAGPTPAPPNGSTLNGQTQFNNIGCVLCHTTSYTTPAAAVAALGNVQANLFSDLLVHHMGPCLADGIVQGSAQGDEFRTPPLWGVGQRIWFMHDGRTSDIVQAVEDHFCTGNGTYQDSEANAVVNSFNALSPTNAQDLINFLRSL
jgi:CxxC motif-containing protein (DUF1111 family)